MLWLGLIPMIALAAERRITRDEVPSVVIDAAASKFPKAKLLKFVEVTSNGLKSYELTLVFEGKQSDLVVAAEGKLLALETVIAAAALPEPVRKALAASKYGKGKVRRAERIDDLKTAGAPPTFEIDVEVTGKDRELTYDSKGTLLHDEEFNEED